ncbi:MAG: excinuclease ABC subunit A [Deltaproteobacteria bacterium RBG_13_65_10]|nr:MAG: excinuclease ABC subunit A [Deltaproteobacteria bacterium RBG_13_65_10]
MSIDRIVVRGAREHNLKGIDVTIPRNKLVVITGLSGSGKSSLAFDTIYAEGQRRYVESLSAYARQFLDQMGKPDVESIEGLSPAISIEQKSTSKNPRSTVGTVTEIYDYLRLLYARAGDPYCYSCGKPITSQSVQQIVDQVLSWSDGTRIHVMAPVIRGRKGEYRKEMRDWQKAGFVRARIDGDLVELADAMGLDKNKKHDLEVVVDRLVIKETIRARLSDSIETALKLAERIVKIEIVKAGGGVEQSHLFGEKFACIDCEISYPEIEPRMFSFNNPFGACPECGGLGSKATFDPELIVPDTRLSLRAGAIDPWRERHSVYHKHALDALAKHYKFSLDTPWKNLPKRVKDVVLLGSGEEELPFTYESAGKKHVYRQVFEGVIPELERAHRSASNDLAKEEYEGWMNANPCAACGGTRLRREARFIKIAGRSISEMTALSVREAYESVSEITLSPMKMEIARRILKEIVERLGFMMNVGLEYLTLDRPAGTLSGGEGQRIRLATQIGSSLVGVLYILDEPSIGLHQRDHRRLLTTLKQLRDLGNTVLIVEHDESTILAADDVIDMGPGAGVHGGRIVAQGTPEEIKNNPESLTGLYLSRRKSIPLPKKRRCGDGRALIVQGARENNLCNLTAKFPLGVFTCVTGVSGSGKSSLVNDTLYRALAQALYRAKERAGAHDRIEGVEHLDKVIDVSQAPIGRTPRSNPATYTGLFTHMRDLFAQLPESRVRGYKAGRYSFNVKGGRCEACAGDGIIRIEMHFLPDIYVTCQTCGGRRYNRETIEIRYKGKNIAEVLDLTVVQAMELMENIPAVKEKLQTLVDVGLDYITLGQSATTLSGGEAQRIKLAKELSKRQAGRTLYILDEPTTGLHFDDIRKLLGVLQRLTDMGNTVIVIEHNLEVIKTADHVIDLGPEGGDRGGEIVAEGTPEDIARNPASHTGKYLREALS